MTHIADKGWADKAFIEASKTNFDRMKAANKISLDDAAKTTGLTADQIRQSAEWIAQPKAGNARRRTMLAYEKGLIRGNDNYRTNGALVNVALATGNIGRPGSGCVRMVGHQEGYSRARSSRTAPRLLRRQALDGRQGRCASHLGMRSLQDHTQRFQVQAELQESQR
jgi:anaerobic selenocysteine-containing dehydrogenase